ncbi:MAG: methyltransferase [Flavobacteriales bacterium]|nr:MAG: methyltransferase [Flavobacteriales bacterium]
MEKIQYSPIQKNPIEHYISCKDYTVSRETFSVFIDKQSELLITTPRPKPKNLGNYYESENYISHSNTHKTFTDKLYQFVRKFTVKQKVKQIEKYAKREKSILDVGSGTGEFLAACKTSGWKVAGVEPNKKANKSTKEKIGEQVYFKIEDLPKKQFEIITLWHVLEHVPNLNEYIQILKSHLKPEGTLIIAVPNYKSYDAKYYKQFWAAYDVPRHLWHFSKKSIRLLFSSVNLEVIKIKPMYFDSFYVSILSEKYKTGKQKLIKPFFVGLWSNIRAIFTKEYASHIYLLKNRK